MKTSIAAPAIDDDELNERRLRLVSDQVSSVRWQITATAVVIAAIVWQYVPHEAIVIWLLAALGVREARAFAMKRMVADTTMPVRIKLRHAAISNAALGLANGSAAFFMIYLDLGYDSLLSMMLVSWAAGGISTTGPLVRSFALYAGFLMIPTAVMWMIEMTPMRVAVGALIMVVYGVQCRFAKQNAAVLDESFRIRRENEALMHQLAIANQAKTRFLAAASHDLRQPLHALALHSSLLAHNPRSPDAPVIAKQISGSIESLAGLLDSLLDISKLDAGIINVDNRAIRLDWLIENVVRDLQTHAQAKGVALRAKCGEAVVKTDPMLLERILRNLIDNAVKYTDAGEISVTVTGDEMLRVAVSDTGRGIPATHLDRVFEEFFQLDNPERDRKRGLGLGLAIVRRLSALLHLDIAIESQLGKGTTVSFTIARTHDFQDEPASPQLDLDDLRGLKVLFIDDEEAVRQAMSATLKSFGCEPIDAATIDEALVLSAARAPDIVLADYRMRHGETGIEAIRKLRVTQPGLPALLISGDTDPQRLLEAEQSGLVMLHKPLTMERLRIAIAAAMEAAEPAA